MGIIKATAAALRGAAADQWKEAFCAGEMGSDLLMTYGKKMTGANSSNNGSGSVITDGSAIIVGEGECALVTEGGKVIDMCDEPGENIFRSEQSKGVFGGGVGAFFKDVGRRISFGGDSPIRQRVYYINTKELTGGSINTQDLIVRFKDPETGYDMTGRVSCSGSYTFRIADPVKFYNAAIRDINRRYRKDLLEQMDTEVLTALAPALAELTEEGIRPDQLGADTVPLREKLSQKMSDKWCGLRGVEVFSLALESMAMTDVSRVNVMEDSLTYSNPTVSAGRITNATANAVETAAANEAPIPAIVAATHIKETADANGWRCSCGTVNKSKFCTECGQKQPTKVIACPNCGWKPDGKVPKFCIECGTPFETKQ